MLKIVYITKIGRTKKIMYYKHERLYFNLMNFVGYENIFLFLYIEIKDYIVSLQF